MTDTIHEQHNSWIVSCSSLLLLHLSFICVSRKWLNYKVVSQLYVVEDATKHGLATNWIRVRFPARTAVSLLGYHFTQINPEPQASSTMLIHPESLSPFCGGHIVEMTAVLDLVSRDQNSLRLQHVTIQDFLFFYFSPFTTFTHVRLTSHSRQWNVDTYIP